MSIITVIFLSHRPPFSSIYRALEANEVMTHQGTMWRKQRSDDGRDPYRMSYTLRILWDLSSKKTKQTS